MRRRGRIFLYTISAVFLWAFHAETRAKSVEPLLLDDVVQNIGPSASLYYDVDNATTASGSLSIPFTPVQNNFVQFPYNTGSYWLRFSISNSAAESLERILLFDYPHVKSVAIYSLRDGQPFLEREVSAEMPLLQRDILHRHPALRFSISANTTSDYFLNVQLKGKANQALEYEIRLYPVTDFIRLQYESMIIFSGFIGFMFSLLVYNLILFARVGIRGYLYYSLYLVSQIIGLMSFEGLLYLMPQPFTVDLVVILMTISPMLCGLFLINFGRDLLDLRTLMPRVNQFFISVSLLLVGLMICSVAGIAWINILMELIGVSMVVVTALVAVRVYWLGSKAAMYFSISFAFLFLGYSVEMFLYSVPTMNSVDPWVSIVAIQWMERYFYYSCAAIEMMFLSMALASYIVQIRDEKKKAQTQALQSLKESNRLKDAYSSQLEHDIAERTEEITQQSKQLSEQTEKLTQLDQAKSRFFANLSHEFRTPLTLIRGPVEHLMAGDYGQLDERAVSGLDICTRNIDRLSRLIEELLMLSELESGALSLSATQADLTQFCRRTASMFVHTAKERNIRFDVGLPQEPYMLYFDSCKLEKILCNLLSNAFKYTPEGGTIKLSIAAGSAQGISTGSFIDIRISDTGPGIEETEQLKVFDRFFRSNRADDYSVEGSGIGLALVKELVCLHGGEVSLQSHTLDSSPTNRSGSCFTVSLPLGDDHLLAKEIAHSSQRIALSPEQLVTPALRLQSAVQEINTNSSAVLLVVEDNEDMRQFIVSQFSQAYQVIEAGNGKQALKLLAKQRVDLVISDIMMPEMDGIGLLEHIRADKNTRYLPVILLTARASDEDRLLALRAQANDFLVKPFSSEELQLKVQNILASLAESEELQKRQKQYSVTHNEPQTIDNAFLQKVQKLVHSKLNNPDFDVDALADELHMSRSTLLRHMDKSAGTSPALFIRQLRLDKAHDYIENNHHRTLAETAYAVGFRNPGYFSKLYKKYRLAMESA